MGKKALLVLSVMVVALLALLPGAGSVLADGYPYYHAYGKSPAKAPGVYGHNHVYDNDFYTGHVTGYVAVRFSSEPLLWIEVGWIKGVEPYPQEAKFFVGWQFVPDDWHVEYFEDALYGSDHNCKIWEPEYTWLVYIDGGRVKSFEGLEWSEGVIEAVSESCDSASPPKNELEGHHWGLQYYWTGEGWNDWDYINTYSAPPSYCLCEMSSTEFTTSGAFPEWSLDWTGVSSPLRSFWRQLTATSRVHLTTATWS